MKKQMKQKKLTKKDINRMYRQLHETYYLNSVLNKILIGSCDFDYMEKTTSSILTDRRLETLKKQLLGFVPV